MARFQRDAERAHQPLREIDPGNGSDGDRAWVLVAIDLNALGRTTGYEGIKVVRSCPPAAVMLVTFWTGKADRYPALPVAVFANRGLTVDVVFAIGTLARQHPF